MTKTIYVTGGTGFVGKQLVKEWLERSDENTVVIQSRSASKLRANNNNERIEYLGSISEVSSNSKFKAIVNLAGQAIADQRWTSKRKKSLYDSRIGLTQALINSAEQKKITAEVFVTASAIGFYPHDSIETVIEGSKSGSGFASKLCRDWEAAVINPNYAGIDRIVTLRLGVVLGNGGMLKKLEPVYKLGLGGRIGSGQQGLSWISLIDLVSLILESIDNSEYVGTYNAVAPHAVSQSEFAHAFAKSLGRPCFFFTPGFVLKAVFGQMADELLLGGQFVKPERLLDSDFQFKHPKLQNFFNKNQK